MFLDKDALQLIQTTAQNAVTGKLLQVPGDGRIAYVQTGSTLERIPVGPEPRNHQVESLDDLILAASNFADRDPPGLCVVWHNTDAVILLTDDSDRRDCVTFALRASRAFSALGKLERDRPLLDQQALIRLLRLELEAPSAVVALFRRLDWSMGKTTVGDIQRGRESLGNRVEAQVSGAADVPEEIVVEVPLYRNPGEAKAYPVKCLVDFDPLNARIQFVPAAGELDRALDRHQQQISARLHVLNEDQRHYGGGGADIEGEPVRRGVPIYYGTP